MDRPETLELITPEYQRLNRRLHQTNERFGRGGSRWAKVAQYLMDEYNLYSVCDYGCGKGNLSATMDCIDYDPAIPGKETPPESVGLVMCTDVIEHIEPELLDNVLQHIHDISEVAYLFIALRESNKWLEDGRNTHLIVKPREWWIRKAGQFWGEVLEFPLWGDLEYYNRNRNKLSLLCRK